MITETPLTDFQGEAVCKSGDRNHLLRVVCNDCQQGELAALERRNRELERAVEDAPHDPNCKGSDMNNVGRQKRLSCNCWKSRIGKEG